MLFKQSKNSFIRSTEKYGYVTNQLTRFDRVYNSTGAEFLRMISREPRSIEYAVEQLLAIFEGVTKAELTQDFLVLLHICNYLEIMPTSFLAFRLSLC